MTRCTEFYEKIERDGYEWCTKDPATVSRINSYLKAANELSRRGIEKKLTFGNLSEGVIRPLLSLKDEEIQNKVLDNVAGMIQRKGKPSASDIQTWIRAAKGEDTPLPPEKKPPRPAPAPVPAVKPSRCMYLTRDDQNCTAPGPILKTCDEEKRKDRGCPLTITLSERIPTLYQEISQSGTGAFAPSEPVLSAVVRREPAQDELRQSAEYKINSGRYTEGAIRQIVQRGKAGDADAAAQLAFETGIERLMDEIESEVQAESDGLIEDEA